MITIPQRLIDEMTEHAQGQAPLEACGILAGKDGRVAKLYKVRNAEQSPVRFTMDPKEQLQVMRELDEQDWDLLGIFHSHPASPAYPSATDISLAFYPDSHYLLISLKDPNHPEVRAYRILNGSVSEVPIQAEPTG
ncbi:MAG: M67 family metallopeptidase [Chloroflexi bacterium]|nr:M67 family metallopeptidase [Chloroflexota bacterium]